MIGPIPAETNRPKWQNQQLIKWAGKSMTQWQNGLVTLSSVVAINAATWCTFQPHLQNFSLKKFLIFFLKKTALNILPCKKFLISWVNFQPSSLRNNKTATLKTIPYIFWKNYAHKIFLYFEMKSNFTYYPNSLHPLKKFLMLS